MLSTHTRVRPKKARSDRLEARINKEQKALFERAAALQGRTLTDFVVDSAREAAVRTIQEYETVSLTRKDQEAFVSALLNPPEPSQRLRQAAARYKKSRRL